jgi:penicillin-binding protein 2
MKDERKLVIQIIFVLVGLIYIVRLFFLQVVEDKYKQEAEKNATRKIIEYPFRGLIYDRNQKLLVINQIVIDLMVVMKEIKVPDTARFCKAFNISREEFIDIIKKVKQEKGYNKNRPVAIIKQLSIEDYGKGLDVLADCNGFYRQERTIRSYPHQSAANALGYIGEISKTQLEKSTEGYYEQGDLVGISGLEDSYEKYLRGTKGVRYIMKDVRGVEKGPYRDGEQDVVSMPGENLYCSIDLELQKYGEAMMQNKIGSIVAIEPSTGEILAFISAPSYDPNALTGRYFSKNYDSLQRNPLKPLFNRPLMAMYPPGSIFKLAQALVGQQMGVLRPSTIYSCNKEAVGVNCHQHPSPNNLEGAIQWSCNPYFFTVFKTIIHKNQNTNKYRESEINYDEWRKHMSTFGFGQKLKVDMPNIKSGFLPTNNFYDKIYGDLAWKHSTIRSLDIGQGELLIVPIQMANLAAIIANKGYYITPHFVKRIGEKENAKILKEYTDKHYTSIDSSYFQIIINGMFQVVEHGTAYFDKIQGIEICGKTGTAQNPHGEDHSVFICFAPKNNPKIAIAVYVENGGFGAVTSAPIANLMVEKYLTDTSTAMTRWMKQNVTEKNLIPKTTKMYK